MGLFNLKRGRLVKQARQGAEKLLARKVATLMTDYVITIAPEKSVADAAAVMVGEDVSALVVTREEKPIGILTERDYITKVPASTKALHLRVKDIMSCSFSSAKHGGEKACAVEAVTPETTLSEARHVLKEKHIRKLVVTDPEGLATGIITQTDLSKATYEALKSIVHVKSAPLFVKEVMSEEIVSVPKRAGFAKAKDIMKKHKISAIPVTGDKEFVGIFTEYDVVTQFYDAGGRLDIKEIPELMKTPIKVIPDDLTIFDANTIMLFEKVRRLMVINDEKEPVGIITQTDLVHACFEYAERMGAYLREGGTVNRDEDVLTVARSNQLISEYASNHLRAYKVTR